MLLVCAGCVQTSYVFTASTKGEVPRQPGPNGCEFAVLQAPPDEPFEEVGTFKHYNGDVPTQEAELKKVLAEKVCSVGAHAVITTRTSAGEYQTATAIKYPRAPR